MRKADYPGYILRGSTDTQIGGCSDETARLRLVGGRVPARCTAAEEFSFSLL